MSEDRSYSLIVFLVLALALVVGALVVRARAAGSTSAKGWKPRVQDDRALAATLEALARKHRQPAMAAALVRGEDIVARAAAGTTLAGGDRPVALDSRFHIGSTTKGLTALLVAVLVHERRLRYDSTLGSLLAGVPMRDEYKAVTVRDLLLHRAGVMLMQDTRQEDPAVVEQLWTELPVGVPDPRRQRLEAARIGLDRPPVATPGTRHLYSNMGFSILGLVAETAADESFESLLASRVFQPLGMQTARVGGWPASPAEPDQPRGHYVEGRKLRPQPLDDEYVFPAWMSPAGGVHCSIEDFGRYARETLRGLQGRGVLLPEAEYREIHTTHARVRAAEMYGPMLALLRGAYGSDPGQAVLDLGYGWGLVATDDGPVSACDGSGGTFFARIVVHPAADAAFVAATTTGGGARAISEAIEKVTGFDWD